VAGDEVNQRVLDEVNASGKLYITHTKLDDQLVLRFAVGAPPTRRRHVERAWAIIKETAAAVAG
jgi:hypothetical protein